TTHRNHGHVIAKGGDPGKVLAEIIGRSGGYLGGRGGTFHVAAPELGIPHTSAIVGGSLPIAAGVAFAVRRRKGQRATLAFCGDGPFFVESRTTRWPGNYGAFPKLVGGTTDIAWALDAASAPDGVRAWTMESDPVIAYAAKLLWHGAIDAAALRAIDAEVRGEVDRAARFALESPLPQAEALAGVG